MGSKTASILFIYAKKIGYETEIGWSLVPYVVLFLRGQENDYGLGKHVLEKIDANLPLDTPGRWLKEEKMANNIKQKLKG